MSRSKGKDHHDWAKPTTQAAKAMRVVDQAGLVKSVGTHRNYQACLAAFTAYIKEEKLACIDLRHSGKDESISYLQSQAGDFSQKTLDMHRLAIQTYFRARGELLPNERLEIIKSNVVTTLEHRAYTAEQVQLVCAAQREDYALSTQIAYAAGLRAHELLTIRRIEEKAPDVRHYADGSVKSLAEKFSGREGVAYVVTGKGGLTREVRIPQELAEKLETRRLAAPERVRDRTVFYERVYDIPGGQKWSNSFSAASNRSLGWSTGAHGLRHSYAQERLAELQKHCTYEKALEVVSQEMGHFRPDITTIYLR